MEEMLSPEQNMGAPESLLELSRSIDGKAEYYVTGGLATAVLTGSDLDRDFSDIDIVVPEGGIDDFQKILLDNGYEVWDERKVHETREDLLGDYGHHEFGARDKRGTRIGIYTFGTLPDGRIIMRSHYGVRNESGKIESKVRDTIFPSEITKEDLFSTQSPTYKGEIIPTVTPEQIYLRKSVGNRPKDMLDLQRLERVVDKERVERLRIAATKIEVTTRAES